jgi:hypothetical protein
MPCITPTPAHTILATAQAGVGRAAVRPMAQSSRLFASPFLASRIEATAALCALAPSALAVPAAHVPLFKAHCSFLI